MKRLSLLATAAFVLVLAPASVFAEKNDRGALFQFGIGPGIPSYPSEIEALMSIMESAPEVERIKIALDIGLGFSMSPKSFIMARIDGTGDRLDDGLDYIQVNLYLYSLGYRYYPKTTGVYFEGNLGAAAGIVDSSVTSTNASDRGPGFGAAIGYDFAKKATGFGINLEARCNFLSIENESYSQLAATVNLCWK